MQSWGSAGIVMILLDYNNLPHVSALSTQLLTWSIINTNMFTNTQCTTTFVNT